MAKQRKGGPLLVLFGDQLDRRSPEQIGLDRADSTIFMAEVASASTEPASHKQRTAVFLAAMRHHAEALRDDGWHVDYRSLTDEDNTHEFRSEFAAAIRRHTPDEVACIRPGSHAALKAVDGACGDAGAEWTLHEDPHFYTTPADFGAWAEGRKELVLEYFYREQRRRLGVLVDDDGKPEGGEWNLDKQNRKTFKDAPEPPEPPIFKPDAITEQVFEDIGSVLPDLPGELDGFNWPVTREQALKQLDCFMADRLASFGDFQDAMWAGQRWLYHSHLSPALNLKLLDPREVVEAAIQAYERGDAPLNAVEGFVRQLIGWREFIRGVYWHEDESYADRNELEHEGSLPEFYWTGETDMACLRDAIGGVLEHAYGHHIERLMLTGNFALIAGVNPQEVNDWYLGMYADAVEWVTTPNTVGMALHADGGVVGTKPYAASGKYVQRMSNHCKGCDYDVKQRAGEGACPFNTFYWDFLIRHRERFKNNRRMTMILKNLERLSEQELTEITVSAKTLRTEMGID